MDICHPDTALWPDVSVLVLPHDVGTVDPVEIAANELAQLRIDNALALAWTTFRALTADSVAICPSKIRPCSPLSHGYKTWITAPVANYGQTPFQPYIIDGRWLNLWCGHTECSCGTIPEIKLPTHVGKIESISIDGVVLDSAAYRVDNGNRLVRLDGEAWPYRQDMLAAEDEVGSFVITYWAGSYPTALDNMAVGILAAEYLKAIKGDSKCRLPRGTRQAVRSGVTYEIEIDLFDKGLTGIPEVDMVVGRHNPNRLRVRPRIVSPQNPHRSRETTWRA